MAPSSQTIGTLDTLYEIDWFSKVGIRDLEDVEYARDWADAERLCSQSIYQNLKIEAANELRLRVLKRDKSRFEKWNEVARTVRPFAKAVVADKTAESFAHGQLKKSTIDTMNWDIIHLCLESEYLDLVEPGFFHAQAFYYRAGHFRCGVKGEKDKLRWFVI